MKLKITKVFQITKFNQAIKSTLKINQPTLWDTVVKATIISVRVSLGIIFTIQKLRKKYLKASSQELMNENKNGGAMKNNAGEVNKNKNGRIKTTIKR